ncbi:hypothetical protein [Prevotella jejuni]|jgi:hypothetical protein|uniref:hypothetical protein n=1 Tax=Prevotella jejuni TaxID=1177574 RepID=UPI001BAD16E2|nr:hypothetical protein [Prevotella jejuni]QUB77578.1 hypothetical protein J4857_06225 [Prevotella jejuni]
MEKDTYLSGNGCAVSCQLNMLIALRKNATIQHEYIHCSGRKSQEEIDSQQTGIQIVINKDQEDA